MTALAIAPIGHNSPPGTLDSGKEALTELNGYLSENPVIQTHDQARQAGGWIERTRIAIKCMEDERAAKVAPLNTQLRNINDLYRVVREPLEKVLLELRRRVTTYTNAEEAKRRAEAERLRLEAEEAVLRAEQAAAAADDAVACADVGELTDAGTAIAEADGAIREAGKAERTAKRAERESTVRLGSVMGGKALSMRTRRVLVIEDGCKALKALGLTDEISGAILRSAKHFEEAHGELPAGVVETYERSI